MPEITIRSATPTDVPRILEFIQALAEYEEEPDAVEASAADIHSALFGQGATTHGLMAEHQGEPVGFAIYFYNFSTWTGRRGIYLEDVFVQPEARGLGAGKALLTALAAQAVSQGCRRFEWSVLDWNAPAIDFYQALGARPMTGWTGYRLEGAALQQLAARVAPGSSGSIG